MINHYCFPEGKKFCVTFSYDDGPTEDLRLAQLFNKYGLKATFNLNDSFFKFNTPDALHTRYDGHEVACHGRGHLSLDSVSDGTIINEVFEQRKILEGYLGYPVRGMAYACGRYNESAIETLKKCGIVYSRTTQNGGFDIPRDFMQWHPTCHHRDGLQKADQFLTLMNGYFAAPRILYIWGHAFEIIKEDDWTYMEDLCQKIAGNDRIWYATNIEIYKYMQAVNSLIISADENIIENPTATDVWLTVNSKIVKIPAGQTVNI